MIERFTDHSANERTYLAWIRTSISIMAFGFLIEKFELFVSYLNKKSGYENQFESSVFVESIGLGLFLIGVIIITTATVRFYMYKSAIESEDFHPYTVKKMNLFLSALMIILAVVLFFYIGHQFFT